LQRLQKSRRDCQRGDRSPRGDRSRRGRRSRRRCSSRRRRRSGRRKNRDGDRDIGRGRTVVCLQLVGQSSVASQRLHLNFAQTRHLLDDISPHSILHGVEFETGVENQQRRKGADSRAADIEPALAPVAVPAEMHEGDRVTCLTLASVSGQTVREDNWKLSQAE
jgi:hypothetical protein